MDTTSVVLVGPKEKIGKSRTLKNQPSASLVTPISPRLRDLKDRHIPAILANLELSEHEKAMMSLYESVALVRGNTPPPIFYRTAVFGSGKIEPGHPVYQDAFNLSYRLGKHEIDIVTGAGTGVMEAANKGAKAAQKERPIRSFGINIDLKKEQ